MIGALRTSSFSTKENTMNLEDKIRDFAQRFDSPNTAAGVLDMLGKQMDASEGLADKLGASFKAAGDGGQQAPPAGQDADIAPDFDSLFEGEGDVVSADAFVAAVSAKAASEVSAQLDTKFEALMGAVQALQPAQVDPPAEGEGEGETDEASETDAVKQMVEKLEAQVKELSSGVPPMTGIGAFRQTEKGTNRGDDGSTINGVPLQVVDPLITDTYGVGQWEQVGA